MNQQSSQPGNSPYGAPPEQPQYPPNYNPEIQTYLIQSILVTLCCCQPFGIVAIVYSAMASSHASTGNYEQAQQLATKANSWGWAGVIIGFSIFAIYFFFAILAAINQ